MSKYITVTQKIPSGDGWLTRSVQLNLRFVKDWLPIKDDPADGSVIIYVGPLSSVRAAIQGRLGGPYNASPAMLVSESVKDIDLLIRNARIEIERRKK